MCYGLRVALQSARKKVRTDHDRLRSFSLLSQFIICKSKQNKSKTTINGEADSSVCWSGRLGKSRIVRPDQLHERDLILSARARLFFSFSFFFFFFCALPHTRLNATPQTPLIRLCRRHLPLLTHSNVRSLDRITMVKEHKANTLHTVDSVPTPEVSRRTLLICSATGTAGPADCHSDRPLVAQPRHSRYSNYSDQRDHRRLIRHRRFLPTASCVHSSLVARFQLLLHSASLSAFHRPSNTQLSVRSLARINLRPQSHLFLHFTLLVRLEPTISALLLKRL
jgi:hypothetical protein